MDTHQRRARDGDGELLECGEGAEESCEGRPADPACGYAQHAQRAEVLWSELWEERVEGGGRTLHVVLAHEM